MVKGLGRSSDYIVSMHCHCHDHQMHCLVPGCSHCHDHHTIIMMQRLTLRVKVRDQVLDQDQDQDPDKSSCNWMRKYQFKNYINFKNTILINDLEFTIKISRFLELLPWNCCPDRLFLVNIGTLFLSC